MSISPSSRFNSFFERETGSLQVVQRLITSTEEDLSKETETLSAIYESAKTSFQENVNSKISSTKSKITVLENSRSYRILKYLDSSAILRPIRALLIKIFSVFRTAVNHSLKYHSLLSDYDSSLKNIEPLLNQKLSKNPDYTSTLQKVQSLSKKLQDLKEKRTSTEESIKLRNALFEVIGEFIPVDQIQEFPFDIGSDEMLRVNPHLKIIKGISSQGLPFFMFWAEKIKSGKEKKNRSQFHVNVQYIVRKDGRTWEIENKVALDNAIARNGQLNPHQVEKFQKLFRGEIVSDKFCSLSSPHSPSKKAFSHLQYS